MAQEGMGDCMDEALVDLGIAVGKLKNAFAELYCCNSNYVEIHIDSDNNATIVSTIDYGDSSAYKCWLCTEE